ncbi:MAG: DUF21 domain-containing protein, partial [Salinibacterium sp.]|nr:DUF21 domain-containing protein [Salinibacterium sp.]
MSDYTLLITYLSLAVGVSFICSLAEAALLTVSKADASFLISQGRSVGHRLMSLKSSMDRPLAAILTLNTTANTIGAAGVGAEALRLFGDQWIGLASALLTLTILVVSEIIPKTLGSSFARPMIPVTVVAVQVMIVLTYPLIILLNALSRLIPGTGGAEHALSREHVAVLAGLAGEQGNLTPEETAIVKQTLHLRDMKVAEIMTPRTAMFMLAKGLTVRETIEHPDFGQFTRVPVYGESPDEMLGIILKHDVYAAALKGQFHRPIHTMLRPIHAVPEMAPVMRVFEEFGRVGHHLFLAVDEYGGTAGVITLEDVIETILGREIVDETDSVADLRSTVATERGEEPPATAQ